MGTTEPVINQDGDTIAVLHWNDDIDGTAYALIDDGKLIRHSDGTLIAKCQDQAGDVTSHVMPDTVTAFYALGLSAHRHNGIDVWRTFNNMQRLP